MHLPEIFGAVLAANPVVCLLFVVTFRGAEEGLLVEFVVDRVISLSFPGQPSISQYCHDFCLTTRLQPHVFVALDARANHFSINLVAIPISANRGNKRVRQVLFYLAPDVFLEDLHGLVRHYFQLVVFNIESVQVVEHFVDAVSIGDKINPGVSILLKQLVSS